MAVEMAIGKIQSGCSLYRLCIPSAEGVLCHPRATEEEIWTVVLIKFVVGMHFTEAYEKYTVAYYYAS